MFSSKKTHRFNDCSNANNRSVRSAVSWVASLGAGLALSLGLAQPASAITFRTEWTGQILGYSAEGAFSYDEDQSYTDGIVRGDNLTNFDISFFDPTGSLVRTFEDNHLTYDNFNFNFDTDTEEILQDGYANEPNGINIGELIVPNEPAGTALRQFAAFEQETATRLNFWSAAPAPDGEPIPHVHLTDFGNEFSDLPIGFRRHLDVAFFTRTRAQLLEDPSAGEQVGQKMTATKVPEPGLLFGLGKIALLLNRVRRSKLRSHSS